MKFGYMDKMNACYVKYDEVKICGTVVQSSLLIYKKYRLCRIIFFLKKFCWD